eukprot:1142854-Pelagomonas_calceolata.AAC.1
MDYSRVMGQKLSSGRPCMPALPGTHNWLVSPQTALLASSCNNATYIATRVVKQRLTVRCTIYGSV